MTLKERFTGLLRTFNASESTISDLWQEIESGYSEKTRYYHTLTHLENLFIELTEVKDRITHWDVLLFSLFYHDIIYKVQKLDNELKSADLAGKRLQLLGVPKKKTELCKAQIIATRSHELSSDSDTNYFLDADLAVLGYPEKTYDEYTINIRKEYAIYPDFIYRKGRKEIIDHFLKMDRIYKTDHFFDKYEVQARKNLGREFNLLK